MEKNYSKLFGESLFKTIKNYSYYSPMLNWRTIGGTIEINRQKLLKCSNYSPMLDHMCRRGRAYLKQECLINFIKNIQKKICRLRNLFLTHILSLDVIGKWIPSNKIFYVYRDSNLCPTYLSIPTSHDATYWTNDYLVNKCI